MTPSTVVDMDVARPRVVVLVSHVQLGRVPSRLACAVEAVCRDFVDVADVTVLDRPFEDSLASVRALGAARRLDVLVCAGATGAYLRKRVACPVVLMRPNGLDLLRALAAGRECAGRVGVLNYHGPSEALGDLRKLLNVELLDASYATLAEAQAQVAVLAAAGCQAIIGSSMITEIAEHSGLQGLLSLGPVAIRQALEDALALHRSMHREATRRRRLDAILHHLGNGVLAVDTKGRVQSLNPAMAAFLGRTAAAIIGADIDKVLPGSGLREVLREQRPAGDRLLRVEGRHALATPSPLIEDGRLEGALLVLQDVESVRRADRHIRVHERRGGFLARHRLDDLVGDSAAMRSVAAAARRYARSNATVLVQGESGTGKELVAQGIHNASSRSGRVFVAVNCGAFPESLLESELFGHEEGAFTGARRGGKPGLIETAHTGTLFLDEIGDMPLPLQSRLLRVLQEREVLRLGGSEPTPVDVRVIAATHRDLRAEVLAGRFRQDLYYRLDVLQLQLPPLRDREGDVEALAAALAMRMESDPRRRDAVLACLRPRLRQYPWPGNVRELENVVERALVCWPSAETGDDTDAMATWSQALPELFPRSSPPGTAPRAPAPGGGAGDDKGPASTAREDLRGAIRVAELAHARRVLEECDGNMHRAAQSLGVSRSTLWRLLRRASTRPPA